jgi:dienelactone hydrolase
MHPIAPVSDEAFAAMRAQFDQARPAPVDVSISVVEETPFTIAEEVVLTFAEDDSATLYVVRPRAHGKPLQPVVFAPAANCCVVKRPNRDVLELVRDIDYVVDGGRALIIPIWFGSYQRFRPLEGDPQRIADLQRESVLAWQRDTRIVMDYLATRADIDAEHAGFLGASVGAIGQGLALAVEPRFEAAVLISAGVARFESLHPMADIVNYAPRITIPVLMINGRTDHIFPYVAAQQVLLDLLGTDDTAKAHIVYDGGHFQYRRHSVARNVTDWFDRHLGPVR